MFTCGTVTLLALCIALFLPVVKPRLEEKIPAPDAGFDVILSSSGQPFYRILNSVGEDVYIGGNETLIRLSVDDSGEVSMEKRTLVTNETNSRVSCRDRYGDKAGVMCWNYIRIAENTSSGELLVCGSNAYSRQCYRCPRSVGEDCVTVTSLPNTLIPVSPTSIPAVAVFPKPDGSDILYSGSLIDQTFQRHTLQDLTTNNKIELELDTVTDQTGFIKAPTFVGKPFEDPDSGYVFVFYREIAVEYERHGVKEYPRVARVCKNDTGQSTNKFVTFVKARLNCSIPQILMPFYYDEIQDVIWNENGDEAYAVFTSHILGPKASALCCFRKADMMNLFDDGDSKVQQGNNVNRLWLPAKVENPRPGTCNEAHITNYPPLMDKLVPNYNPDLPPRGDQDAPPSGLPISNDPIFHLSGVRFTSLAIDFDFNPPIYFFGTSAGTVIKAFKDGESYKHVEINNLVSPEAPVTGLTLLESAAGTVKHLLITTEYNVITWPLTRNCSARYESDCSVLRYGYCVLSGNGKVCVCDNADSKCENSPIVGSGVDRVLAQPAVETVSSCDYSDIYLYCQVRDEINEFCNISWAKDGDKEFINNNGHLVKVESLSDKLLELKITVHNKTEGKYNCSVEVGGSVYTKQVSVAQESCLTRQSLQNRCTEYENLKRERQELARGTCNVKVKDCDSCRLGSIHPSK